MYTLLIFLFMLICFLLTFVILIQSSKGGGLAGTFGGMDTMGSLFGGRGSAPFLQKVTAVLATVFVIIALLMSIMTRGSVSQESLVRQQRDQINSSPARTLPQVPDQPVQTLPAQPNGN